jgi:hypothetical protein
MLDAEEIARQDEKPVVLQRDCARRSRCVERKQGSGDEAGLRPIGAPGIEGRVQRVPRRGPPQVKEAVVKKFQTAASSAPAMPAAQ